MKWSSFLVLWLLKWRPCLLVRSRRRPPCRPSRRTLPRPRNTGDSLSDKAFRFLHYSDVAIRCSDCFSETRNRFVCDGSELEEGRDGIRWDKVSRCLADSMLFGFEVDWDSLGVLRKVVSVHKFDQLWLILINAPKSNFSISRKSKFN